jgi:alpha-tubulin suppressor-like RCC1 family protein
MLGLGDRHDRDLPTQVGHGHDWKAVYQNPSYVLAVKKDGSVWSWGACPIWAPSDPAVTDSAIKETPTRIGTARRWASVACGARIWIVETDGTLWDWGGRTAASRRLVQVGKSSDWKAVFSGGPGESGPDEILAVRRDGTLWVWRDDIDPGFQRSEAIPRKLSGAHWLTAAGDLYETLAIRRDGTMWAWTRAYGSGDNGRAAIQVGTSRDWVALCCGQHFSVALKKDGTLWGWGRGGNEGDDTYNDTPTQVGSARDWVAVSCGQAFTMALAKGNTLWGMGDNSFGQLGLGSTWGVAAPAEVGASR